MWAAGIFRGVNGARLKKRRNNKRKPLNWRLEAEGGGPMTLPREAQAAILLTLRRVNVLCWPRLRPELETVRIITHRAPWLRRRA